MRPSPLPPLRFLFDYISPYAYLAWTQVEALAARHGREVEPVPVLFAGILGALGTRGPAEVPPKRDYLFKHTSRIAHGFGVPFAPPPAHPFNPLLALRVTAAVDDVAARRRLVSALFAAAWGGGGGVETEAQVGAALAAAELPAALLEAAATAPVKARVRQATEDALAAGAFGVPTFLADGELFFGVDSLGHLDAFLRGEDPLSAEAVAHWRQLPASATRKQS
jgi:2-hydroxychromene-2-carboxylate isomerase